MKKSILLLFICFSGFVFSQQVYNTKKGVVAEGYDVVAYFSNEAIEGDKKNAAEYDGVKFYFSSKENLKTFLSNPIKYIPKYGGFCAYAMGAKAKKVSIDPETFEIRDGDLYLFYNSWGRNTLTSWIEIGPEKLKLQADKNWKKFAN